MCAVLQPRAQHPPCTTCVCRSTACAAHKRADNSANPDPTACSDDGHAAQQGTSSSSSTSKSHAAGSSSSSSEHKANTTAALGSSSSNNTSPCSSTVALSDLQELAVIGSGSSGVVKKVLHRPTQQVCMKPQQHAWCAHYQCCDRTSFPWAWSAELAGNMLLAHHTTFQFLWHHQNAVTQPHFQQTLLLACLAVCQTGHALPGCLPA